MRDPALLKDLIGCGVGQISTRAVLDGANQEDGMAKSTLDGPAEGIGTITAKARRDWNKNTARLSLHQPTHSSRSATVSALEPAPAHALQQISYCVGTRVCKMQSTHTIP